MNTIGRYYEVSLNSAMNNTYEFYVPLASSTMSLDELQMNAAKLQSLVDEWTIKASDPGNNNTETNNATSIVNILQGRLDEYNRLIAIKLQSQSPTSTDAGDQYAVDQTTGEPKKDYTMLILIGAGIGAFLLLKKKGKKVKGTASKSSMLLPLLIGGGIVYYLANKKYGQATTQSLTTETATAATRQYLPGEPIPGEVISDPSLLPLGSGGQVIDESIYNETLNYTS